MYGRGISKNGELIDLGNKIGIIEKAGAWYSYGDLRIGQGRENAKQYMADNPDIAWEVEDKIRASYGLEFQAPKPDMAKIAADKVKAEAAAATGTDGVVVEVAGAGASAPKAESDAKSDKTTES